MVILLHAKMQDRAGLGLEFLAKCIITDIGFRHTCQLSRFCRETPDFEEFFRSPDLNEKSPDISI